MHQKPLEYTADMIKVLSAAQAIRSRPAMYLGPIADTLAPTRLLQESLCLALDAACCGTCTQIAVILHPDGSATVEDDGPGLSQEPSVDGRPHAQVLMTELFACRDHKEHEWTTEAACQIGIAVTNALSEWCVLTTASNGRAFRQQYVRGEPQGPFEPVGDFRESGTTIRFKPDGSLLAVTAFDPVAFGTWAQTLRLPPTGALMRITDEGSGLDQLVRFKESR